MNEHFRQLDAESLARNAFTLIGKDWMLITAGTRESYNTMTANWGGLGFLWNRNVCFCFVRPQRYTFQFMEKHDRFSLSFFTEDYRSALDYCGSNSGRETDKAAACGLIAFETSPGIISFEQANLIMECRKIYCQDVAPHGFVDRTIAEFYPAADYHRMYVGELLRCLSR